jgi:hypothetical protein
VSWAFVQSAQSSPTSSTTVTTTLGSAVSRSDKLIAAIGWFQGATIVSVQDNLGNNLDVDVATYQGTTPSSFLAIYSSTVSAGATSVTVTFAGGGVTDCCLILLEYSGIGGIDVSATNSGQSANITATVVTTKPNELLVSLCGFCPSNIASGDASFTMRTNLGVDVWTGAQDMESDAPGSYTGTWTQAGSDYWTTALVAYKLSSTQQDPIFFATDC